MSAGEFRDSAAGASSSRRVSVQFAEDVEAVDILLGSMDDDDAGPAAAALGRGSASSSSSSPPQNEGQDGRLGYGHARMSAEELEAWAQSSFSEASAMRTTEGFAAQEARWAAEAIIDGRGHWSVREAARLYSDRFRDAIDDFQTIRLMHGMKMPVHVLANIAETLAMQGLTAQWLADWPERSKQEAGASIRVAVRKRPLLPYEEEHADLDVVEADQKLGSIICHDGRLARNGKRLVMEHRRYLCDDVFSEDASNAEVSQRSVAPLLRWAQRGRAATLLCYGQTGTGKTHTLGGVLEYLAEELGSEEVEATFFEVRGKKLFDLLGDRKEVQLRADAENKTHISGAQHVEMGEAQGGADVFRRTLQDAMSKRASEATERNAESSRSHAILILKLRKSGGRLRLVDLAGSERNYETEQMSAAQHRESAEINASLMALKDCFRAHSMLSRGEKTRMPFRASRLTQCLRDCFEDADHRFLLIATVSPTSTDVIHTGNTLSHAVMMVRGLEEAKSAVRLDLPLNSGRVLRRSVPVAEWTSVEVAEWVASVEKGRFAELVLPPALDGRGLLALSSQGLATLFERTMRSGRGDIEGISWNIAGELEGKGSGAKLGRALFAAVRREAIAASLRSHYAGAKSDDSLGVASLLGVASMPSAEAARARAGG
eukprot:TRINITY_DN27540_c0_g1_i1.p1 TRINITY_DN27540_c0_g1~~TRINITY_DN27540_c0_g1_i1.p1  ORF type:complete len:660 (-),score=179.34 TRINITY_DN27540_c0_g1_i1:234-2213(-)